MTLDYIYEFYAHIFVCNIILFVSSLFRQLAVKTFDNAWIAEHKAQLFIKH